MNEMLRLAFIKKHFLLLNNCFTSTFAIALKSAVKSCTVRCQILMLRKQRCQLLVSCWRFSCSDVCASAVCQEVSSVYRLRKNFLLLSLQDVYSYYLGKKRSEIVHHGVSLGTLGSDQTCDFSRGGKNHLIQHSRRKKWSLRWHASHGRTPDI